MSAGSERGTEKGRGGDEERGLGSRARARARLPATQLHVRKLGRSAPRASDKGWEDACARQCSPRAAPQPPERLRPPLVSDCKDHSITLGASPHPPGLAVPGACVLDPERGLAQP